jgi:hypothetical protein
MWLAAIIALGIVLGACGRWTIPVQQPESRHLTQQEIDAIPNAFPVTIYPPDHARYQPFVDALGKANTIHKVGWLTSVLIDLRRVNVPVVVQECGAENAFYMPSKGKILVCYEFMALIHRLAGSPPTVDDEDVTYMLAFTTLHEIGHALIDLMNVRINPRDEEERADQFAFLVLTNYNDRELARKVMHAPASFFIHLDDIENHDNDDTEEHGRSVHRATNAICLLWGRQHDPALADRMAGERGARCDAYTSEVLATWNGWLRPYTRIDTGRAF